MNVPSAFQLRWNAEGRITQ